MTNCSFSPSLCHIDLSALRRNFARLGQPHKVMPVIKSDAYGHGLMPVARTLDKAGCQHFAVGTVSEGVLLREAGFNQEIVPLLGALTPTEWKAAQALNLTCPLIGMESLKMAAQVCKSDSQLEVAIALNTGMGRLGFGEEELPDLLEALRRYPNLKPVLAISHYACADDPKEKSYTEAQLERFISLTKALRAFYPSLMRSLNNSAASLLPSETPLDLNRPGITLYGGNPFKGTPLEDCGAKFEWVMSVSAPILQVRRLKRGESVSYGRLFTAPQDMDIAIIGIGYATGFGRSLSNRIDVLINGRRCPQIGRVCMGMIMADISRIPKAQAGDEAWIMGGTPLFGERVITAEELAHELGTISYEVLCLFGATNKRVYHD